MKRLILIVGIASFVLAALHFSVSTLEAQYSSANYNEIGGARTVIGGDLDIISGGEIDIEDGGVLYMEPTDTTPTAAIGYIYFDLSDTALKYHNGTGWIGLTAGTGDNTLDNAYDQGSAGGGKAITADTGAVAIANTDADTAFLLTLGANPSSSAALGGMEITLNSYSTENGIEFENSGSGDDIQGTGDTWSFTKAGVLTAVSGVVPTMTVATLLDATSGITLDNDETITNATDTEIKFAQNAGEDLIFDMDASTNIVGLKSSTGVIGLAMGAVDDLSGVGSIAFDTVASSISLASAAGDADLTIQQTGANDSSVHIKAAGTGADAISIATSAGGMDITVAGSGDAEDLDITSSRSLTLTSSEDTADAIKLNASAGGIDIDAVGAAAQDIVITNTGGSINIVATENQANAILIDASDAAGGMDIDAGTGGIAIDITGEADFRVDSSGGSVVLVGAQAAADAITIDAENAAGGIDMDFGTGAMVLTGTGTGANLTIDVDALSFDFTDSSNFTVTSSEAGEDLTISQITANDSSIIVTSAGTGTNAIEITTSNAAGDIDINAGDAITVDAGDIVITTDDTAADQFKVVAGGAVAGDAINLGATDGGIVLTAGGATNGDVTVTAASTIAVGASDDIAITLTAGTAGEDLSLITTGGADSSIVLTADGTSANAIDIDTSAGGIDIDMTGGAAGEDFALDTATSVVITSSEAAATDAIDINATGAVSGIDMDTTNGPIALTAGDGTNGDIGITAGDDLTVTAAGDLTFAITGTTTLPDNQLRRASVEIAADDMDQLAATQQELVASPGASAYLEFVSAIFALDYGGTAWTEPSAPDDLVIRYTDGDGAIVSQLLDATGFATAIADTICQINAVSDIVAGTTAKPAIAASAAVNQALVLDNTGNEWTNSGNSPVTVIVYYRVHTTTELGL